MIHQELCCALGSEFTTIADHFFLVASLLPSRNGWFLFATLADAYITSATVIHTIVSVAIYSRRMLATGFAKRSCHVDIYAKPYVRAHIDGGFGACR